MQTNERLAWVLIGVGVFVALAAFVLGNLRESDAFLAAGTASTAIACCCAGLLSAMGGRGGSGGDDLSALRHELSEMAEKVSLSDDARRVLNRSKERDLLCRAIEEDIQKEDWDAAIVLCDELASSFGYRHEAEGFRARIAKGREYTVERRVTEAIAELDGLLIQRKWEEAFEGASRIQRLFPESTRVAALPTRVEASREQYKRDLERRFLLTAEADRIEEAMQMLAELDHYLTPEEAERLKEVARGVIGKARENLGVRFKLAVQDHRWDEARSVGGAIIEQFPNTRMAQEVREVLGRQSAVQAPAAVPDTGA
ncbi:MAG: hypothetical protein AAF108_08715 [Planctomycetota bacterium]